MLVIQRDGPLDIGELQLEVESDGKTLLSNVYRVPQESQIPTTVAIVSNGRETGQAVITLVGWQLNGVKRTIPLDRRDAIVVQIPTKRLVALPIVLSARCTDNVELVGGEALSTCPEEKTCDHATGVCSASVHINASTLADYHPGDENKPVVASATPNSADAGGDTSTAAMDASATDVQPPPSYDAAAVIGTEPPLDASSARTTFGPVNPTAETNENLHSDTSNSNVSDSTTTASDGTTRTLSTDSDSSQDLTTPNLLCGNGYWDQAEACDDSNVTPGDGCSEQCEQEVGWSCSSADGCIEICGDGLLVGAELQDGSCDDQNSDDGDGCSSCRVETGYICSQSPSQCEPVCGDGYRAGEEECEPDGSGICNGAEAGPVACRNSTCGDGYVNVLDGEQCEPALDLNCNGPEVPSLACRISVCGDGSITAGETCDQQEDSAECNGPEAASAACQAPRCGDGYANASAMETCDPGPTAQCTNICTTSTCGDGIVNDVTEQCDRHSNGEWPSDCLHSDEAFPDLPEQLFCQVSTCGDGYLDQRLETCADVIGDSHIYCPEDC